MKKLLFTLLLAAPLCAWAQQSIPLTDLSAFDQPSKNWTIEQAVFATYADTALQVSPGKGVLVNTLRSGKYHRSDDLKSKMQHGDIRLLVDFMLPKGMNSGIYLQGRYEVQLYDSWGKKTVKYSDCGGIYERWDDSRGKGKEGYEGYAPRQNASKAPGLWQTLEIDFQAPRFDANGKKIANAIFKKVILNGLVVQENIEVSGMTRGAIFDKEAPFGPILIQGDHGPVAFRNLRYETYEKPTASLGEVSYDYYTGKFTEPIIPTTKPVSSGKIPALTYRVIPVNNDYLIHYKAELTIPEDDNYEFQTYWTGSGELKVDGVVLNKGAHWFNEMVPASTFLKAGKHVLEIVHIKDFPWGPKALGLQVKRIGARLVSLHERTSLLDPDAVGLIEVKANAEPVLQRSFAFHQGKKKTHVIHVGDPAGLHYSYDLKQGAILQVWRGKFLDATQMWDNRGEPQTSEPLGLTVVQDGKFPLVLAHQTQPDSTDLVYKGYRLEAGLPIFMYEWTAAKLRVEDRIQPAGNGLKRTLTLVGASPQKNDVEAVLATGHHLSILHNGLASQPGNFMEWKGATAELLKTAAGASQIRVPFSGAQFTYDLIW
jgi:hypothetical protein